MRWVHCATRLWIGRLTVRSRKQRNGRTVLLSSQRHFVEGKQMRRKRRTEYSRFIRGRNPHIIVVSARRGSGHVVGDDDDDAGDDDDARRGTQTHTHTHERQRTTPNTMHNKLMWSIGFGVDLTRQDSDLVYAFMPLCPLCHTRMSTLLCDSNKEQFELGIAVCKIIFNSGSR